MQTKDVICNNDNCIIGSQNCTISSQIHFHITINLDNINLVHKAINSAFVQGDNLGTIVVKLEPGSI